MSLCTDRSFVNGDELALNIRGLRCKRWSCDICRPFNRQKVMHAARCGQPNLFMTLTCKPGLHESPDEAAQDMKRGLVLLRRRIERRWGVKNIPFIVVFEATQAGWPHMHLLLRAPFMPWQVLRAMWQEITGAFSVDVRFIKKATQVLFYVTKYIGKALHGFKGCKRWWRSHNYDNLKEVRPELLRRGLMFQRIEGEWHQLIDHLYQRGWQVEQDGRYSVEVRPGWGNSRKRIDGALWASLRTFGAGVA